MLAAGTIAWAALPTGGARPGAKPVLLAAIACAVFAVARLGASGSAARQLGDQLIASAPERLWRQAMSLLLAAPWAQLMIVAVLGLEALHPRRPWHTAVLGVVLLGFLAALYLAESGARLSVFRPQLPFAAAGIGLAALSVAAAALPATSSGSGSGWLAVLAAVAAILAAALALPV
jgi:hypothetical protein